MSYQTLAQKYRPQGFDEVIGQEVVARTLKNSIDRGRVANAYIFCGPRGVGKTSVARLVAKMLNCEKPSKEGPCNNCISCKEITQGNSMDVLEIDGASNRGIDEIRTLRENVKFSPTRGKFKIYIIDEVHMLTQEAFNALLKTLEEPPSHVKFIFATTEAHKVLPTIMSRCQKFDFKRIPPGKIFDRLEKIAKKEKIDIDQNALLLIARSADGSLRDAIVILDQMVSFTDKKISQDDVLELLGMLHKDKICELSNAVIHGDVKATALLLDELINSGKDPVFITNGLLGYYRDLMILKTSGEPTSDMAFTDAELEQINEQKEKLSLEEVLYILQNISSCLIQMKGTMFTRAPLEICLIRMARRKNVLSLEDMVKRLEDLEKGSDQGIRTASYHEPETVKKDDYTGGSSLKAPEKSFTSVPEEDNGTSGSENGQMELERVRWETVLKHIKNKKMSVFTFLSKGKLIEFNADKVVIGFGQDHAFNKEVLESKSSISVVEEALSNVLGKAPQLEFKVLEFLGGAAKETLEAEKEAAQVKEKLKPVIEKAMDVFGGHVLRGFEKGE